jgi:CDP-glucose 4,6-dehydratase
MSHPLADFYRGKRVLVTGHTGFEGGWAVAWLKHLGAQVYGYGLPPATRPNFFDATLLDRGITSIFSDVRDRSTLANAFTEFQPEIVLHCALRSNPQFSRREPVETFSTNVMGTVQALEEARLTQSVRAVVIVNSARANDHAKNVLAEENQALRIRDASMACSELAHSAFSQTFLQETNSAVASGRATEAIGGGDWGEGRIVPNLVRSLTSGEPVHVAEGAEVPIWHVLDLVHAYLLLAQKLFECGHEYSRAWDFAPSSDCRRLWTEVAKDFVGLWDAPESNSAADQQLRKYSSNVRSSETRTALGWAEILSAEQALRWTVEWYRAYYANPSLVWRTTEDQVERYMKSAPVSVEVV